LPETSGKSLEEIGELYGDTMATNKIGDINVAEKTQGFEMDHVEDTIKAKV
jgi:hypothetical protein